MTITESDFDGQHGGYTGADTIKPRRIRWAWKGRLALGYLSLWSGESSLGKSAFACWLIAALTHGQLEGNLEGKPADVLILASEDAREDMWVPRLMAAGADLTRVKFQDHGREWNLRDGMSLIEDTLDQVEARLIFVDSVLEVLPEAKGSENINSPTFVRRSIGPFSDLCKTRHVAGLVSTHPPKSKGTTFADNVMASAAFVHMTRVGLLFAWHPDDLDLPDQERRRVLMRPPGGSNIGRDPGTFEFEVLAKTMLIEDEPEEVPYTTTPSPSDVSYRDLTRTLKASEQARTKTADARSLIDERLADGLWHPSMIDELVGQGFTKSTAYRAAEPCEKRKAADGAWWWAARGTPKDTFVEVRREGGNLGARAGGGSRRGNTASITPQNDSIEPTSQLPAESDETPPPAQPGRASSHVPASNVAPARENEPDADAELARLTVKGLGG
jgi:putative DNA primase/helicase